MSGTKTTAKRAPRLGTKRTPSILAQAVKLHLNPHEDEHQNHFIGRRGNNVRQAIALAEREAELLLWASALLVEEEEASTSEDIIGRIVDELDPGNAGVDVRVVNAYADKLPLEQRNELIAAFFSRSTDTSRAALCLGLAVGAKLGGAR